MDTCEAHKTGELGEAAAIRFLRRRGYRIIGRNLKSKIGELDVVAATEDTLVFVEVKTRTSTWAGEAYEAVDYKKQRKLNAVIQGYLAYGGVGDISSAFTNTRIDVIGVLVSKQGKVLKIDHIQDAFTP